MKKHGVVLPAAALAAIALLLPGAAAAAANATWTGGSASDTWSTAANWSGGVAPGGRVGALTLPSQSAGCASWSCNLGVDDLATLTVGTLQIDSSNNYLLMPASTNNVIELTGGLSFSTSSAPLSNRLLTRMVIPLTLGAKQSWNVSGVAGIPTQLELGAVTGETHPLQISLSRGVTLQAPELDTGPLTLSGPGDVVIADQMAEPADDVTVFPPPLIASAGVSLEAGASLGLTSTGTVSGAITVAPGSYSTLQIGHGVAPDGTATVDGDVTLRSTGTLQMWIDQSDPSGVPQPGTDASQLTVSGDVDLNNASLALSQGFTDTQVDCSTLSPGQVYTLITAGHLIGNFAGIPTSGQVEPLGVCNPLGNGPNYEVLLSYDTHANPETFTATVIGPAQVKALTAGTLALPAASARLSTVLSAGGYPTSFDAPSAGTLALTWTALSHHRRVTIATAANVAHQVGERALQIKLTAAGRALLYRADNPPAPKPKKSKKKKHKGKTPPPPPKPKPRPVQITANAQFTPSGQSPVSVSRRYTLR